MRKSLGLNWAATFVVLLSLYFWSLFGGAVLGHTQDRSTPQLQIFADTAGVSPIGDSVYVTWIFAKATPRAWPSSGILVAFDCKNQKVQRLAHVVYRMRADSTGVEGDIIEDRGGWVPVTIPRLFNLICEIGTQHDGRGEIRAPAVGKPKSPYSDA